YTAPPNHSEASSALALSLPRSCARDSTPKALAANSPTFVNPPRFFYHSWVTQQHSRRHHAHFRRRYSARFRAQQSGQAASQTVRLSRQKQRRSRLVPARLESHMHQRARLFRQRNEVVRIPRRGGSRRERR